MNMSNSKKRRQSGSSMVESLMALILLCLLFFGAFQLFQWGMAKMFCSYSSFYAAKAFSLGYAYRTISKAARIAAIPISGRDENGLLKLGRDSLTRRLRMYMSSGNAGVDFPYWDASGNSPDLRVSLSENPETNLLYSKVTLRNAPYVAEGFGKFLRITNKPVEPSGYTRMVDHSTGWSK